MCHPFVGPTHLDHNFSHIIIGSDSIEAIHLVSSDCDQNHPYVEVISHIRQGLSIHGDIDFSYAPGEFNLVTNWLASATMLFCLFVLDSYFPLLIWGCHRLLRIDVGGDFTA